jgi:uncharacterized protein YgiM (DUF1202 family)
MKPILHILSATIIAITPLWASESVLSSSLPRNQEATILHAEKDTPEHAPDAEDTSYQAIVTSTTLNVRAYPSIASRILGTLSAGNVVTVLATWGGGTWLNINFKGQSAYIYAAYTRAASNNTPNPTPDTQPAGGSVKVTATSLNVRATPSIYATIIGQLPFNAVVQLVGKSANGAWLKVNYNGREGWIASAYTQVTNSANTQPPNPTPTQSDITPTPAPIPTATPIKPVPTAPLPPIGAFELGGHVAGTQFVDQMRDIGMKWVKIQIVMPTEAVPDYAAFIQQLHNNGLRVLIGAIGNRQTASDTNYHKQFAQQLANLARQGADAIEVWNEPNLDREYGYGKVSPDNYVNMLREAYSAIKGVNASTLVIGGAMAPTGYFGYACTAQGCGDDYFLNRMGALRAERYMDCMGAHHNGSMVGPDQRNNAPVGSPDHHSWYFWGTLDVTYNAFGGRTKICWTELGYLTGEGIADPLPGGFSWASKTTLANHAQWLARAVTLSRSSGKVRLMIIWNVDQRGWGDDPQAGFSIFRPDGTCPACATIKTAMSR